MLHFDLNQLTGESIAGLFSKGVKSPGTTISIILTDEAQKVLKPLEVFCLGIHGKFYEVKIIKCEHQGVFEIVKFYGLGEVELLKKQCKDLKGLIERAPLISPLISAVIIQYLTLIINNISIIQSRIYEQEQVFCEQRIELREQRRRLAVFETQLHALYNGLDVEIVGFVQEEKIERK